MTPDTSTYVCVSGDTVCQCLKVLYYVIFKLTRLYSQSPACSCIYFNMQINSFSINFPLTDKPGSWFLLAKSLKNTCESVTFQVKMQVIGLHYYLKCHSSTGGFKTFASGTLVKNGLNKI